MDFTGTLQCDGYAAYRAFANGRGEVIALAGCWAHVRRKFYEAIESAPRTAGWIVRQLQHLYRVEANLRELSPSGARPARVKRFKTGHSEVKDSYHF